MNKTIIVGFAILAVSTSAPLAKGQAKPKADAAATTTGSAGPFMTNTGSSGPFIGQVSAADRELYRKSQREVRNEKVAPHRPIDSAAVRPRTAASGQVAGAPPRASSGGGSWQSA